MDVTSFLLGFQKGKASGGGGNAADVRYVTFMNGAEVLYVKPVATGDDCVDVLTKGLISTPTKDPTVSTVYTYSGWSLTDGGAKDSGALKAVTENRTVYAAYTSAVRKYTITYYDSDGVTVLKAESLAYGATPSYAPTKDGFNFDCWVPALATVTGDASYTAQFSEKLTFAGASWADIARISEAGEAADYFQVGDTKYVTFNFSGTTETAQVRIVGFNHDDLADESGKAGISVVLSQGITNSAIEVTENRDYGNGYVWENSETRTLLNSGDVYTALPEDLKSVIKSVIKTSNGGYNKNWGGYDKNVLYTTNDKVWLLSSTELGFDGVIDSSASANGQGSQYEYFTSNTRRVVKTTANQNSVYATRSMNSVSAVSSIRVEYDGANGIGTLGVNSTALNTTSLPRVFGFCI